MSDFEAIYREHIQLVWRALLHLGVSRDNVEDAAQDVFLVVYRRYDTFEARSSLRTWIYGIALRVARDYRRRQERKRGQMALSKSLADVQADPAEVANAAQERQLLYSLLGELEDAKREVMVLARLEEMTVPEVAELLGLNVNGVYARLRAARLQLERAVTRHRLRDGTLA